jgi:hypothetical protein
MMMAIIDTDNETPIRGARLIETFQVSILNNAGPRLSF